MGLERIRVTDPVKDDLQWCLHVKEPLIKSPRGARFWRNADDCKARDEGA